MDDGGRRVLRRWWRGLGQRHADPEHAAAAELGAQADLVAQQFAQPLHDGQAQTGTAVLAMAFAQAAKFLENFTLQAFGNAGPLVMHFDAQLLALASAAYEHAALGV